VGKVTSIIHIIDTEGIKYTKFGKTVTRHKLFTCAVELQNIFSYKTLYDISQAVYEEHRNGTQLICYR